MNNLNSFHWAFQTAEKVIREKGPKDLYTCASGITPSGTVHIGNFREIISVEIVVRALLALEKKVRFIYSWDDYDVFRKVPANMPQKELLETFLRKPITMVPDVLGYEISYARANEKRVEDILPLVGISPEFISQAERYRHSFYASQIRHALRSRDSIRLALDEFRTDPLPLDWWPVSVFCDNCDRDTTDITGYDDDWEISYSCRSCDNRRSLDLRKAKSVRLPWRIDWPMRWAFEKVDFEPAGKDHHSQGGSFDTARKIVSFFDAKAPVSFQYDFIRIKGHGGKISSSSGDVLDLYDVLEVYTPEITRYLFVSTKPNAEFAISFDLDVLKIYEDYEKCERIYFNIEPCSNEKKRMKEKVIYELSQVGETPKTPPYAITIRHLCTLLQIYEGDFELLATHLPALRDDQKNRLRIKAKCAWHWITQFSPEDFRFTVVSPGASKTKLPASMKQAIHDVFQLVQTMDQKDEKTFGVDLYSLMKTHGLTSDVFFPCLYQILIAKDKGPRLIPFLYILGKDRILPILQGYEE